VSTRAFEDGLEGEGELAEERDLAVPGVSVCTSRNAGNYYCAHAFYVLARWSEEAAKVRGRAPGVGFLHVPADDATTGDAPATGARHEKTGAVLAAALRGVLEARAERGDVRVLLTGYGPFQGVVDNPTGAFVSDVEALKRVLTAASGVPATELPSIDARGTKLRRVRAGPLDVHALVLEVSDAALDAACDGSLPWALDALQPDLALSLGVHRASTHYRVELLPTNGGLAVDERGARHAAGNPVTVRLREQPLLARAIEAGARALVGSTSRRS
jgi:pyrrolidone-carboxylate peptidase